MVGELTQVHTPFVGIIVFGLVLFGLVYLAGRVFAVGVRHERRSQDRRDHGGSPQDPAANACTQSVAHGDPSMPRPARGTQPDDGTDR